MGLDVTPGLVHAQADGIAAAGDALGGIADDLLGLFGGPGGLETDQMIERIGPHLAEQWNALADNARNFADTLHASAESVSRTEETNTAMATEFFRGNGGDR